MGWFVWAVLDKSAEGKKRCLQLLLLLSRDPSHYVKLALETCVQLISKGKACWLGDLWHVLFNLTGINLSLQELTVDRFMVDLISKVDSHAKRWLQSEVDNSVRLYLLHGRLEPMAKGPSRFHTMFFCYYLRVPNAKHRKSMTHLLLSDHSLALEMLRRGSRYQPPTPRDLRLCGFCETEIESPEQALLVCDKSDDLCSIREEAFEKLSTFHPSISRGQLITTEEALPTLHLILFHYDSVQIMAKFIHSDVLSIFEAKPILFPAPISSL
jgi:hypothetical protein